MERTPDAAGMPLDDALDLWWRLTRLEQARTRRTPVPTPPPIDWGAAVACPACPWSGPLRDAAVAPEDVARCPRCAAAVVTVPDRPPEPPKPPDYFEALLRWMAAHEGRLEFFRRHGHVEARLTITHEGQKYGWGCAWSGWDLREPFPALSMRLTECRLKWERQRVDAVGPDAVVEGKVT